MTGDHSRSPDRPNEVGDPRGGRAADRRLQDLLRATTSIVERLDLEVVLRRIVEAGQVLVGARYGALGVIGPDGRLDRFIHVGVDEIDVSAIGRPPKGAGLLGAVIDGRMVIRSDDVGRDERTVGFPDHHPQMTAFLGVPIRVRERVYGNLYLADGAHGAFTDEDEEIVVALAATAGIAIENARLYDEARTREKWNATIADVMAAMLDVTVENILDVIAERVADLIEADLVCVLTPRGEDMLEVATAHGYESHPLRGRVLKAEGTLAHQALATRQAVSILEQPAEAGYALAKWRHALGPTLAIPLFAGDEALGALTVSRKPDGLGFTDADVEMAFAFAAEAGIAIEVVRGREDRRRMDTTRDRARIARDLHDHVIQRLFGAGLALQAVSAAVGTRESAAIEEQIDAMDAAIKDIRTAIFALSSDGRRGVKGLRDRLLDIVADVADSFSTPPHISFAGPLDSLISPGLADDAVAVFRELLTNVVKHAHARTAEASVTLADDALVLVVMDDGAGMPETERRSGLANIADRAVLRGGQTNVTTSAGEGTRVEWRVPAVYTGGGSQ